MVIATLKIRRLLFDAVIDPCLCNLVVWVEIDGEESSIHVGPCCSSCRRLAMKSVQDQFSRLPIVFDD